MNNSYLQNTNLESISFVNLIRILMTFTKFKRVGGNIVLQLNSLFKCAKTEIHNVISHHIVYPLVCFI